jgi:diguanylate cyclase (GGDEF)-like protein/PAS domain S-box-containing protein
MDDTEQIENRFKIGFEQAAIGAAIADLNGVPMRVNSALCSLFGRPEELLVGRLWTEYTHPDEVPLREAVFAGVVSGHDTYEDERRYVRPDGTIVWVSSHVRLVRDEWGVPQYFLAQLGDITERKQVEHELAYQALHDSLTGLPNRTLLTDRLAQALGATRRLDQVVVMFLDVDRFKVVNDELGHTYGDDLLRLAAARITRAVREGDTVARFGGDEFVVVCEDVSPRQARQIAERILEALNEPCLIGGQEVTVTASLGIAIADEAATPESLLKDSDAAMYRAKERGRGGIELFNRTTSARRGALCLQTLAGRERRLG